MTISLEKGTNVTFDKVAANAGIDPSSLTKVEVGLGWNARKTAGEAYDLDASAVVLGENGKAISKQHFVFFNNLSSPEGAVVHHGDNLTGDGDGDDEKITVDLNLLNAAGGSEVVFAVSIYKAAERRQNFGGVDGAFVRLIDANTGAELARFDLTEDSAGETTMKFAKVYVNNGAWKFKAIGEGYKNGLDGLAAEYGI